MAKRTLIFTALGLVTTLGVAWGVALVGVRPEASPSEAVAVVLPHSPLRVLLPPDVAGGVWCRVYAPLRAGWACDALSFGEAQVECVTPDLVIVKYFGWSGTSTRTYPRAGQDLWPDADRPAKASAGTAYRFGWPFAAFWTAVYSWGGGCERHRLPASHLWTIRGSPDSDTPLLSGVHWGSGGPEFAVPTGLIASGFALDTATFGGAWWLGFAAVGAGRRRWRTAGGRCKGCGYDRRGLPDSTVCPECGTTR